MRNIDEFMTPERIAEGWVRFDGKNFPKSKLVYWVQESDFIYDWEFTNPDEYGSVDVDSLDFRLGLPNGETILAYREVK